MHRSISQLLNFSFTKYLTRKYSMVAKVHKIKAYARAQYFKEPRVPILCCSSTFAHLQYPLNLKRRA